LSTTSVPLAEFGSAMWESSEPSRSQHSICRTRVLLFWAAFILTRPLGATVGDFLDKPKANGGMALSHPLASTVIAAFILFCLLILPQRAGRHPVAAGD
jgi:uncharacterized membrane-anchored protein